MCNRPVTTNPSDGQNPTVSSGMGGLNNDHDPMVELAAHALAAVAAAHQHEYDNEYEHQHQRDKLRRQKDELQPEQVKSFSVGQARSPSSILPTPTSKGNVLAARSNITPRSFVLAEEDPLYYQPAYSMINDPHDHERKPHDLDYDDDHTAGDDDSYSGDHNNNHEDHNQDNIKATRRYRRSPNKKKPTPSDPGWTAKHYRRHFVRHNYHDHSHDKEQDVLVATGQIDALSARGGVVTAFPLVLHNLLTFVEEQGLSCIVSWQPHGRAFSVHDTKAFVEQVMPTFFRQSKISSFQRQLNLYGFCRLTGQGPDRGAYYNEFFLRGRPDLTVHMQRTRVKGTGVRTSSNPQQEPNFYEMDPVGVEEDCDPEQQQQQLLQQQQHRQPSSVEQPPWPTVVSSSSVLPRRVNTAESSSSRELFPTNSNDMKPLFEYQNSGCWNPSPSLYDILERHHDDDYEDRSSPVSTSDPFDSTSLLSLDDEDNRTPMDFRDEDVADMALFLKDVDLGSAANTAQTGGDPFFKVEATTRHVREDDLHEV